MSLAILWTQFLAAALLILFAAPRLTRNAEIIAARRNISDNWIGLILLASVTSLPELAAGISSVSAADAPDIAVGAVFGSCVFNLAMLVVLDFVVRGESVYRQARQAHILSAGFGTMLIGFAGLTLMVRDLGLTLSFGHIGATSLVIVLVYIIATRAIHNYEADVRERAGEAVKRMPSGSLTRAQAMFAIAALAIILGGLWLPLVGAQIADQSFLDRSVMGTIFIAAATSLPELSVSLAALRLGSVNMAIANLLGSNLFNILILAIEDVVYTRGTLLDEASNAHAVTAMAAVIMCGVVIAGLLYRPKTRLFRTVGWTSIALFLIYILNVYAIFLTAL